MKKPFELTITAFHELEMFVGAGITKVISIHDADAEQSGVYEERIRGYFPKAKIVFSYFDDVDYPTEGGPQENEIELLLAFSRGFEKTDKILIHCRAGISRSTAVAYAILCQHAKPGQEGSAYAALSELRPQLFPNRYIVQMADRLLQRKGRLMKVAEIHGWRNAGN